MVVGRFWSFSFQLYLNSLTAFNYTVLCTLLFSWRSFRKTSASSSPSTFFLQYGDKRFQVTSNPENGIFLPSPFTEHLSHKLSLKQNSSVDERPFFSRPAGSSSLPKLLWSAKILFGDYSFNVLNYNLRIIATLTKLQYFWKIQILHDLRILEIEHDLESCEIHWFNRIMTHSQRPYN